jgi:hypothetical protein
VFQQTHALEVMAAVMDLRAALAKLSPIKKKELFNP